MTTWKNTVNRIGHLIDTRFDRLRYGLKQRLGYDQPLQVIPYAGYGNAQKLFLNGRVLVHQGDLDAADQEALWRNLVAAYRRFESDEVPGLRLRASFQDQILETITDEEGYFHFTLPVHQPLDPAITWHPVTVETPAQPLLKGQPPEMAIGQVLVPPPKGDFGIISDIDDTVLITGATNLLTMARLTFLQSPHTRLPFEGIAAFYQALSKGNGHHRPIFYVSSSPWNLYDFLVDFLALNQIPAGPLLLRDLGLNAEPFIGNPHQHHKITQIAQVMQTYPQLPFILIGDSGQHDPEAYAQVVATRPEQVLAIYIRDVSPSPQRDQEIAALSRQTQLHGIDMVLVNDTFAAAKHAAHNGYIDPSSLAAIRTNALSDAAPPGSVERVVDEAD